MQRNTKLVNVYFLCLTIEIIGSIRSHLHSFLKTQKSHNAIKVIKDRDKIVEEGKKKRHATISWHGLRHSYAQKTHTEAMQDNPKQAKSNRRIPIEQAEHLYLNNNSVDRMTIEEFYTSNVERRFVCNEKTKICHINKTDGCFDATRGEMFIKYSGNGDEYRDDEREYIYLTLSDATALGYTMCPKCE